MSFTVTTSGVRLPVLPEHVRSVDIFFDEDRVWSIDLSAPPRRHRGRFPWPSPLQPYLVGSTRVILRDSGSGEQLSSATARFTEAEVVTRILDDDGVPLAINKWGRLGKTLEAGNSGVQERILDRTEEVIAHLTEMGLRPFVVGGTLLGAVRDHALLPHDDDADVAYLSEHTNPADVAHEGFEVGRRLKDLGYELVRHSATHMQLYFRDEAGRLDHYVDVFSAFFTEDGNINQPFHVRGEMRVDQMLPFSTVTIQGRPFPAPADSDHWLVVNYDENWRTPIPGYRLETPWPTIRRFRNWFGSFHVARDAWNDHYRTKDAAGDAAWRTGAKWILAQDSSLRAGWLVDLGCGTGALGAELLGKRNDRRVVAADYSPYALEVAAGHEGPRSSVAHVNLYRNLALALPTREGIDGPFDLVANHLFDHVGSNALPQAFRLARMALRSGGSALATLYGEPDPGRTGADPPCWPRTPGDLAREAAGFGLAVEVTRLKPAAHERRRAPYGVRFALDSSLIEETR